MAALAAARWSGQSDPVRSFDSVIPVDPAPERLRVLVLGGTNYVGPHLVRAALERGHEVTIFNRGYTNPDLFHHVERLTGNRFDDRGPGLDALRGTREWDVVIDTWKFEPGCVSGTTGLLAGRAGAYIYISSIAVLGSFSAAGLDETAPTVEAGGQMESLDPDLEYSVRKRAGELVVERDFGDRATIVRCSSVYGFDPAASTGNQEWYWPLRFLSGEPVLVPDDPTAVIQWTDARDVGRFAVRAAEDRLRGVYHLINARRPIRLLDYLDAWHEATGHRSAIARAPRSFLDASGVRPWVDLPVWIPADDPEPGFFRIRAERAHATGFTFRPLGETIADVARTFATPPAPETSERLSRRRELELIWRLRSGTDTAAALSR